MHRKNYTEVEPISYNALVKGGKYKVFSQIEKGFADDISGYDLDQKYDIKIYRYHYIGEEKYWDKLQIHIEEKDSGRLIAEINTNYHSFNGAFIHQNNQDFLITSGDYQGYTIVNLSTKTIKSYLDLDDYNFGTGFCTYDYEWDEYDNELIARGCVWACPEEEMHAIIPDLNNPIEGLNNATYLFNEPDDEWYEEDDE